MGTLTEQVVLELRPSDPRWLFEHPDAVATGDVLGSRTITLPLGSAVARELRWLITDPELWSDGLVPQAVPAGLVAPARMLASGDRRWWTSARLPGERYLPAGGGVSNAADVLLTKFTPGPMRRAAERRAASRARARGTR